MTVESAGPPIVCPVTGRAWPRSQPLGRLKDCTACGGKIDTRHEAWQEGWPPGARHLICPEPARAPGDGLPEPAQPKVKAAAVDPRPGDDVHAETMRRLQVAELAASNGAVA